MKQALAICTCVAATLASATPSRSADPGSPAASESPAFRGEAPPPAAPLSLWYRQPARIWEEALPVGNGIMGAMVYGGVASELIQFNEHTVWTGKPHSYQHEGAVKFLPEIRKLLFEGKQKEAEALAGKEFMSIPLGQKSYQPFGELHIDSPAPNEVFNYRRWLDLDTAVASTEYKAGDTTFRREVLASHPDRLIAIRISADKPGAVTCSVRMTCQHRASQITADGNRTLVLRGEVEKDGIRFESRAVLETQGGQVSAENGQLQVTGANSLVIRLVGATNFTNYKELSADPASRCAATLKAAAGKSWERIEQDHISDHQKLFRRVSLDLGQTPAMQKPTDERLAAFSKTEDPQLAALVFQYGRYLLIGSSREGGQPANLQGIWNDKLRPPWDSKYTCNINTEMNYWPAETTALGECHLPLFDALAELMDSGRATAKAHYGARGWVLHHNFDLWRGTAPINASNHGIWPMGSGWLSTHLWEHYLFTGDKEFLRQRAYPIMREAALFYSDNLVEDPKTKALIDGPSNSPEHGGLVMGPTMDHQIIRVLFGQVIEAARVLKQDPEFAAKLKQQRARIAPNKIGQHGQLQEWMEDKDNPNDNHRHVSHMWGVFPGDDITWRDSKLFQAAKQSLIFRGDIATGWSMGWKINLWARFLDGNHAMTLLKCLLRPVNEKGGHFGGGGLYPNLFDAHPPFQIDGNFGATSGITEMLLQSHVRNEDGTFLLDILPALPTNWPAGKVTGLKARGGFTVDISWSGGKPVSLVIRSTSGGACQIRMGGKTVRLATKPGVSYTCGPDLSFH